MISAKYLKPTTTTTYTYSKCWRCCCNRVIVVDQTISRIDQTYYWSPVKWQYDSRLNDGHMKIRWVSDEWSKRKTFLVSGRGVTINQQHNNTDFCWWHIGCVAASHLVCMINRLFVIGLFGSIYRWKGLMINLDVEISFHCDHFNFDDLSQGL